MEGMFWVSKALTPFEVTRLCHGTRERDPAWTSQHLDHLWAQRQANERKINLHFYLSSIYCSRHLR